MVSVTSLSTALPVFGVWVTTEDTRSPASAVGSVAGSTSCSVLTTTVWLRYFCGVRLSLDLEVVVHAGPSSFWKIQNRSGLPLSGSTSTST